MSDAAPKPWTIDQFFAWQCRQHIGITLLLTEIYDGVEFPVGPRLVRDA